MTLGSPRSLRSQSPSGGAPALGASPRADGYRRLVILALLLTLVVVVFGAYVRLSDAGLGCPDWPGCYGKATPAHAAEHIAEAESAQPGGPVSLPKAWKEMIHRYLAATLGFIILVIAALALRNRRDPDVRPCIAVLLVGVVIFQGLLGKWTVTLLLKPAIVTGHLIGGLTTLALLALLAIRATGVRRRFASPGLVRLARFALLLVVGQIVLGGWTSTNYAALACTDFPTCHGSWWPSMDVGNAFHVVRELGMTATGDLLSHEALTAIHWAHRLGAVATAIVGLLLVIGLLRQGFGSMAMLLLLMLSGQVGLGIANVALSLPLPLAVAHNAGAALLLLVMVLINARLMPERAWRAVRGNPHENAYA
ncbi:COX15/CtaA family protein [Denitromonas iodatirespirans]|uniref:COX15/CtaA family protein n=1 Tax=Denitromonas iodatirespirans TaxID=2795389 RepID=A0A944DDP6_DENI1|nr:COX15/CtaA family protein [Denitromonas iodatirespirans]MBT0962447.1 COX15/CtaA family protein [Denitromonas iodatirespirans]